MRANARTTSSSGNAGTLIAYIAVWNWRLQIAALFAILCGASIMALDAAGPQILALFAGEGMMIDLTTE